MTFTQGVIQVLVGLAPLFMLLVVLFVIFSWIRVVIDAMSGRGL